MKILIVDDKKENLYLLETLLKGNGFEVATAPNGEEALKNLHAEGADMVISDILMPVMDGFQLCREVRADKELKGIPFVFYTATYTDEKDEEFALRIGADMFIRKPVEPIEFVKRIRGVIQDVEKGRMELHAAVPEEEGEIRKLYNERLVNKLEKKLLELERLEQRYRTLCESVNDFIFSLDENGYFTDANCRTELLGYAPEDIIGKHFIAFMTPAGRKAALGHFKREREGISHRDLFEVELLRKNGTTAAVELSISTIYVENRFIGRFGIARDISERKLAEEVLRESEERFRATFEQAAVGIAHVAPDGRFLRINGRFCDIVGYTQEEMLSRTFQDITYPDDLELDLLKVKQLREGIIPDYSLEKRYIRKDGALVWVTLTVALIREMTGEPRYFIGVVEDIAKRKHAEQKMISLQEQLFQAQKMEAIGQLAGGIAHDFNNLLTIIHGNCQLSMYDLKEGDPLKANIEEIRRASERAAALTRQILAFSRKQMMEMKVFNLNAGIKELEKMLRRIIEEDINLVMRLADDLGRVKADPGQIEQVIINLVVNARDAMPRGGTLTIETGNVELDEEYVREHIGVKPGSYVMLSISDTGAGMSPEIRERIFEPFFTTKEKGRGTGLGLSTVYGIVKQSEGDIWVYSEPDKGTIFKIYLPRTDEAGEKHPRGEAPREIYGGSETILIIEDEEPVRKLAVRILGKLGYQVLEALNLSEALFTCEHHADAIHLIITDVVMPQCNGPQLVEKCMKARQDFKVLYMSGYTDESIVHHGVLEEGVNFIQKPFNGEDLARKVRGVLDK